MFKKNYQEIIDKTNGVFEIWHKENLCFFNGKPLLLCGKYLKRLGFSYP